MRETNPSWHSIVLYDKLHKAYIWVCWAHETEPMGGAGAAVVWDTFICPVWDHLLLWMWAGDQWPVQIYGQMAAAL